MAYTQEYLDAVVEQVKGHLPPALFKQLHLAAKNGQKRVNKQERPRNQLGLNAPETLVVIGERRAQAQRAQEQGLEVPQMFFDGKFSQSEAVYEVPSPSSELACGTCRFFLRREDSELGRCQVVDGDIAWFGTCQYYISSDEEAAASFPQTTGQPELELVDLAKKVVLRDGKYCVTTADGSRTLGCHATRAAAEAQLRAIEANKGVIELSEDIDSDDLWKWVKEHGNQAIISPKFEIEKQRPPTTIQSYIFDRERFDTRSDARQWLRDNDIAAPKGFDDTEESFRARQFAPGQCKEGSFRTIDITNGVKAVICRRKDSTAKGTEVTNKGEFLVAMRQAFNAAGSRGLVIQSKSGLVASLDSNASLRKAAIEIVPPSRLSAPVVFVAASPGPNEAARGTHLAGPNGRTFRDLYLKSLGLEMQDVGFIHAVPQQGGGDHWGGWLEHQLQGNEAVIVALGGAAKQALNGRADFILPYPAAVRRKGDSGEVTRKMRRIQAKVLKLMADRVLTDSIFSGTITLDLPGRATKSLIERPIRKDARVLTRTTAPIIKADASQQVVYGVVLTPYVVDTQEDWVPPADIEEAAHRFIRESRVIGKHHNQLADADPVESFIEPYPTEEDRLKAFRGEAHKATRRKFGVGVIRSGEWVLGTKVHNSDDWASVTLADEELKEGSLGSYSMGGVGIRVPITEAKIPEVEFIDLG